MALSCYRIYYKYTKCLVVIAVIAFFVQIFIAVYLFPSEIDKNVVQKILHTQHERIDIADVSARKSNYDDDEDLRKYVSSKPSSRLRVEELDFVPACEVISKEAISAIHRAKTQFCKQQIVNITCRIQKGHFYPTNLPNFCKTDDKTYSKYLGCYQDDKKQRILSSFYGNFPHSNSPSGCLDLCVQAGLPYAGVQYGSECFCGDHAPNLDSKISEDTCDMKCPSNPSEICGGYFTMNIYETGLKKFTPRIPSSLNAGLEPAIRIVFLLTLNGRALRQVHRLINSLYRSNHYFYIHIDARQDYLYRKLLVLENQFANVKLARERYSTIWGGASLLTMLLSSMKQFFELGWRWDFVINLSESDFPIKSLRSLETFLTANKGLNFVKSHGREVQRFIKKQGLDKTFVECETHMWRIGERKLPKGIVVDGGSDWIALSSEFVAYVVKNEDELLNGLSIIFKHTLLPAESYFHTVLRNSAFCDTYVDNNLHVTNWKRKLGCKCQYKHVVDWCGCSPNDFRTEDWPRIQSTQDRQLYFARKFEPIINQEIITRVEQFIGFDDHYRLPNIESYWQNIYDIEDLTASSDDLLLTHARSIVRHNAKILLEEGCILQTSEILEINSYNNADVYKGNLILHKASFGDNDEVLIETWYKPQKKMKLNSNEKYVDFVKMFLVSSEYDQKETTFRNLGNILGPLSEPTLLFQLTKNIEKLMNFTVVWLEPTGRIADVNIIQIEENNFTNFIKPDLKLPLLPGVWKVVLLDKTSTIIVSTTFLVSPLEYFSGKEISNQEKILINKGSRGVYKKHTFIEVTDFLPNSKEQLLLQKLSDSNVERLGEDLKEWIDNLHFEFYNILGSCINIDNISTNNKNCGKHSFELCNITKWSSLAPDPKGFVGKLNTETGRLDRT